MTQQPTTMRDNMCTLGKRLFSIRIRMSARINHYRKGHAIKGNNIMMVMALKVHKTYKATHYQSDEQGIKKISLNKLTRSKLKKYVEKI